MRGRTSCIRYCSYCIWRAMRQRGETARLYQLSESTESTQKSCRRPCSSLSWTTLTMPRSSNSKKLPQELGKTRAGRPACPKTRSSMSRPRAGEDHLWYSRFIVFLLLEKFSRYCGAEDLVKCCFLEKTAID